MIFKFVFVFEGFIVFVGRIRESFIFKGWRVRRVVFFYGEVEFFWVV